MKIDQNSVILKWGSIKSSRMTHHLKYVRSSFMSPKYKRD